MSSGPPQKRLRQSVLSFVTTKTLASSKGITIFPSHN